MDRSTGSCYQCGLPIPKRPVVRNNLTYCCYGCVLANEITGEKGEEGEATWILAKLGISAFFSMNVMVLSYAGYFYPFESGVSSVINYLMFLLTTPVIILLGIPILMNSVRGISELALNMDTLIVIGTLSAYGLSVISTLKAEGGIYFDTASMILLLVTVGRFLEARAKARASNSVKRLIELSPKEATVIRGGVEKKVPLESLKEGDTVKVIPGEVFAVDGEVIYGEGSVDESMLTGESRPVFKEKGSRVFSGTSNIDGVLILRATHLGEERTLLRLFRLLEEARKRRAPIERLADRVSSIFIPIVILTSVLTFTFWSLKSGIDTAIMNSLSVLLISCPCALGIAAPMAIWVALGRAANGGVLIRSGETLERLSRIKRVLFDKTGTVTKGVRLSSVFIHPDCNLSESYFMETVASLESLSEHPLGKAISRFASTSGFSLLTVSEFRAHPGMGVQGTVNGKTVYTGSMRFMERMGLKPGQAIVDEKERLESQGKIPVFCGWDREVKGVLGFSEEPREDVAQVISILRGLNIEVLVITGDSRYAGWAISKEFGIEVKSELLPEDKVREVESFKGKSGLTAMVGDGINDAPALKAADVGIALGCGADITRESADVSLIGDDLKKIPWILLLGRKTRKMIKENLFWAFLYNTIGMGLAASGTLQPVIAAAAMIVSSTLVLGNSLRLERLSIEP